MRDIDFKQAALDFTRKHSCPPALVIEAAMKEGAALAVARMTIKIMEMRLEMEANRKRIEKGTPHGWANANLERLLTSEEKTV